MRDDLRCRRIDRDLELAPCPTTTVRRRRDSISRAYAAPPGPRSPPIVIRHRDLRAHQRKQAANETLCLAKWQPRDRAKGQRRDDRRVRVPSLSTGALAPRRDPVGNDLLVDPEPDVSALNKTVWGGVRTNGTRAPHRTLTSSSHGISPSGSCPDAARSGCRAGSRPSAVEGGLPIPPRGYPCTNAESGKVDLTAFVRARSGHSGFWRTIDGIPEPLLGKRLHRHQRAVQCLALLVLQGGFAQASDPVGGVFAALQHR